MSLVFEAEHTRLGQRAAIKVLREEHARNPALVERFEREGRAISRLKSPHVVRVIDVDSTPAGAPYLVMELLEGSDLSGELAHRGPFPVAEAVEYVVQACRALAEAHHRGIIHRDIKPANLFLAREGAARVLKVIDFGIARDLPGGEVRLTQTETVMGTPLYMAPEQFRGVRDVDARADVWALGATLYELLAGKPPFFGTAVTIGVSILSDQPVPLESLRPDVPPALAAVVARTLEKDRDRRYASASALGEALEGVARSFTPVMATPPSTVFPMEGTLVAARTPDTTSVPTSTSLVRAGARRTRTRRIAIASAALAAVLGGVAFFRTTTPKSPSGSSAPATADTLASPVATAATVAPPEATRLPEALPSPSATAVASTSAAAPVHAKPAPSAVVPARAAPPPRTSPSANPANPAPSSPPLFFPGQ
jgi:serine/threonine-protein kinase